MAQSALAVRSRTWCFTAWEDSFEKIKKETFGLVVDTHVKYWTYGLEECPATLKKHWQGYMEFDKKMSLRELKIKFPNTIHWERRLGTQEQAIKYCHKDGTFYSFGEKGYQGKRNDLEQIKTDLDTGMQVSELADTHFSAWLRYRKGFDAYTQLKQEPRTWKTEVHVIWGPTGTGKTRQAFEAGAVLVEFDKSGFAHNYNNEDIILWDDFDPDVLSRAKFLTLTDRYPTTVNVKNGTKVWNPKVIYITTNYNCRDWYGACKAVRRRLTSITYCGQTPHTAMDLDRAAEEGEMYIVGEE